MNEQDTLAYVRSAAAAIRLPMDDARARAVAMHLGRTFGMVSGLMAVPLLPHDELAEIYRPAPFPAQDPEGGE